MFDLYLALGDSMSIDHYAAEDASQRGLSAREDIGAASLLFRNDSSLFPEFDGRDLVSRFSQIQYANHAIDGGTTKDLLSEVRLKDLDVFSGMRALVTVTIGGNDLLEALRFGLGSDVSELAREYQGIQERYEKSLRILKEKLPGCTLIVSTIFDPTDGTGIMPSNSMYGAMPIQFLVEFNKWIASCARSNGALVADVYRHFLGHGAECGSADNFWYWKASPIEASYIGSSEIRRVWLDTLDSALLG